MYFETNIEKLEYSNELQYEEKIAWTLTTMK